MEDEAKYLIDNKIAELPSPERQIFELGSEIVKLGEFLFRKIERWNLERAFEKDRMPR